MLGDDKALAAITLSGRAPPGGQPSVLAGLPVDRDRGDLRRRLADGLLVAPSGRAPVRLAGRRREIDLVRALVGREGVLIHPIGGIADEATVADLEGMVAAIQDRGAIGGSLYDWDTSNAAQWAALRPLRDLRNVGSEG